MLATKIRVNLSYCEVEEYLLSLKKFSVALKVTKFLLWTLADKTLDLEPSMFEHDPLPLSAHPHTHSFWFKNRLD